MNFSKELFDAIIVAKKAMEVIMKYYKDHFNIEIKSDKSPVTDADKASNELIYNELKSKYPTYAFLTEEMADNEERLTNDYVWIIDPLDGTEDFIRHDDQFCINIALSYKGQPAVGVVAIPVTGEIYYASLGCKAYYLAKDSQTPQLIHVNDKTTDLIQLSSVCHQAEQELTIFNNHKDRISSLIKHGSAIKACLIASGKAELTFRFGAGSKEWDTCAPQAVVSEAGGIFVTSKLEPITYNKKDVYNRDGFFIVNSKDNLDLVK